MQGNKFRGLLIGGAVLLVLVIWIVSSYNGFVSKEEAVKKQWSEVQNTYQRRLDLIPNLVNVVKGQADFEKTTLEQIASARAKALSGMSNSELTPENYNGQEQAQNELAGAANKMIIMIENYPVLKGSSAYAGLQTQLEGTERRVKVARKDFNGAVADYNKAVRGFPGSIIAKLFGFKAKEGYQADAGADKAVEIKFN